MQPQWRKTFLYITFVFWVGCTLLSNSGMAAEKIVTQGDLKNAKEEPLVIKIPPLEEHPEAHQLYFRQLLVLALDKTVAAEGPYVIRHYSQRLSSSRFMKELKSDGVINVIWDTYDTEREKYLLPIKISMLRELNDYRVLLIREGDQGKFDALKSEEDLKKLEAGSGTKWPVTQILQDNGYNVVTAVAYDSLFKMLSAKRFDYYPRGLHQAWNEQKTHKDKHLVIEKRFLLHTPAPFYFYVNQENTALAERIALGLSMAIADGSFDQLFYSTPGFRYGEEVLRRSDRILFELSPHE